MGELWCEENINHDNDELISDDMMATFNLLTIGYDAAWTEAERLSEALAGMLKELNDALAALEESQQNAEVEQKLNDTLHGTNKDLRKKLVEAQQTIARQAKVMKEAGIALNAAQLLAFFIEKDGKPVDGFRFREIARNMMTLLDLMDWLALGNKEGSDKA